LKKLIFSQFARKILSHIHDYLEKHISIISLLLHKVSPHNTIFTGYFYKKNVFEWLISRVFGNFTVTFVNGPLFRAKKHPKTKSCSRKKIEILELCSRTFFSYNRLFHTIVYFRPLVPFSHLFCCFSMELPFRNFYIPKKQV
jgi:hypothetical protein